MLNVIFAFCMFLSGLGFNLNATLEGAGIDAPLAAGATEDGPLSDLLIAVNDISIENQVTDEEFYAEEDITYSSTDYVSSIDDIEADLLADHHAPAGCGPRVRRCRPKARCCKPKVRKCKPKCRKVRRCAPKVRKCKPKCHPKPKRCCKRKPVKRCCKPKVRKCKPKCHKVRRCAPKVRKCKPVKRCCKPKVRKCNPKVRKCAPVRKPVVRKKVVRRPVAPVGCAPRVVRQVKRVPVGCAPAHYSQPSHTELEPVVESHYPVQRYDAPVSANNQPVGSGYTGQPVQQPSTIQVPPTYRAPSPELQEQAPDRASVSSIW